MVMENNDNKQNILKKNSIFNVSSKKKKKTLPSLLWCAGRLCQTAGRRGRPTDIKHLRIKNNYYYTHIL